MDDDVVIRGSKEKPKKLKKDRKQSVWTQKVFMVAVAKAKSIAKAKNIPYTEAISQAWESEDIKTLKRKYNAGELG
jgi:hypothetical protein